MLKVTSPQGALCGQTVADLSSGICFLEINREIIRQLKDRLRDSTGGSVGLQICNVCDNFLHT